jgi:hypothetical protein
MALLLSACSDRYKVFSRRYTFKSVTGEPDYSRLDYWAAHPWKKDPSDSIPKPLRYEEKDSIADVFFMHPTTYTVKLKMKKYNADIDDSYLNAKTDYSSILYQASVFNQSARIFAPRYRQANIKMFFMKDKQKADTSFELAYRDLKTAFEYYLQHWNNGRPIIIAAHSQGSKLGERLLKEFFENKPLATQLVVAYFAGWPVPKDYFSSIPMCEDSMQTACICSWRTLRKGFLPYYIKPEKGNSFVTNPLLWTTSEEYAPKQKNKGSVLMKFNKMYCQTTDAQIANGVLWVKKPRFPWSFLYFTRNYHVGDINLFYLNVRENVRQRIAAYVKNNP